jgi:hypothetical protein
MFRPRETMIALRARRHAYRIASRIAQPRIERPDDDHPTDGPQPPGSPVVYPSTEDTDISWFVLLIAVLLFFVYVLTQVGH